MSYLKSQRPPLLKAIIQPGNRKRLTVLAWTDFVLIATVFEAMGRYFHSCSCQEARASLSRRRKCREETEKENMMN